MRLLKSFIATSVMLMNMSFGKDTTEPFNADQDYKPLFSFGIIADIQYADAAPAGTRYYRSSLYKLRAAVTSLKQDSVDFVITLGDMIDRNYNSFKPLLNILDSSGLRYYHVTGNHDYSVKKAYKKRLPNEYTTKPGYYSFVHHNFRLVFLNGNEISTYSSDNEAITKQASELINILKNNGESNAVEWNGGISYEQLEWLDNQLNEAKAQEEKVFIFCHFPVYPDNVHNLLNHKEVVAVLDKYRCPVTWFNGHNHAGNYGKLKQIHFVTMKGMVETERENSFARIDVYRNKIGIVGFGREKSQILEY